MADPDTNSPVLRDFPSPLSQGSGEHFDDWRIIGEQQDFYDEQDCLHPSSSLASEKLKTRKEDDVVIFDYSLDPDYLSRVGGNPPVEEGGPLSESFGADHDRFFQVHKRQLTGSEQFDQIIDLTKEPSRGPRLGIM